VSSLVRLVICYILDNNIRYKHLPEELKERIQMEKFIKSESIDVIFGSCWRCKLTLNPVRVFENDKCWIVYYQSTNRAMQFITLSWDIKLSFCEFDDTYRVQTVTISKYMNNLETTTCYDKEKVFHYNSGAIVMNFKGGTYFNPNEIDDGDFFIKDLVRIYWKNTSHEITYKEDNRDYCQILARTKEFPQTCTLDYCLKFRRQHEQKMRHKNYKRKMQKNNEAININNYVSFYCKTMFKLEELNILENADFWDCYEYIMDFLAEYGPNDILEWFDMLTNEDQQFLIDELKSMPSSKTIQRTTV